MKISAEEQKRYFEEAAIALRREGFQAEQIAGGHLGVWLEIIRRWSRLLLCKQIHWRAGTRCLRILMELFSQECRAVMVSPTMSARMGTGGNNVPLVEQEPVFCIAGNAIDRQPQNGGNGLGYQPDIAYTLTATDHHAVFSRQRVDVFKDDEVVNTQSARQQKDATDLVMDVAGLDCRNVRENGNLCGTLQKGTSGNSLNSIHPIRSGQLIRRLTPLECERLQGFPDGWTDIPCASDSARYKALGNSVAILCVDYVLHGIALVLQAG